MLLLSSWRSSYKLSYGVKFFTRAAINCSSCHCRTPTKSVFPGYVPPFYCTKSSTNSFGWRGIVLLKDEFIVSDTSMINPEDRIECRLKFLRGPVDPIRSYQSQPLYYPIDCYPNLGLGWGYKKKPQPQMRRSRQSRRRTIWIMDSLPHLLTNVIIVLCSWYLRWTRRYTWWLDPLSMVFTYELPVREDDHIDYDLRWGINLDLHTISPWASCTFLFSRSDVLTSNAVNPERNGYTSTLYHDRAVAEWTAS